MVANWFLRGRIRSRRTLFITIDCEVPLTLQVTVISTMQFSILMPQERWIRFEEDRMVPRPSASVYEPLAAVFLA